jgi:hypothetical protein
VWCGVVVVALAWGTAAVRNRDVGLHAAPFKGHWGWHGGWRLLPAAGVGLAVARWGPEVAARLPWRRIPWIAGAVAAVWTAVLAAGDGVDRIASPLTTRFEYEPFAAGLGSGDLGRFLSTYVDRLGGYPIHVQGHPPGPVVLAWLLDRVGLGGAGWLAVVAIGAWGVAVGAVLVTARVVAGERAARRAAPTLAVLPAAVWAGTSVDPVFAALGAVAIALATAAAASGADRATAVPRWRPPALAVPAAIAGRALRLAAAPPRHRQRDPQGRMAWLAAVARAGAPSAPARDRRSAATALAAVGGGLVFGAALLCSYGAVPLAFVLVAAVAATGARGGRHRLGVLVLVGAGALAALGSAALAGFWWPAGLEATRAAYWDGIGSRRPGVFMTLVGNPAVVAVAAGPLVALGLGRLVVDVRGALASAVARAWSAARAWPRGSSPSDGRSGPHDARPAPAAAGSTTTGPGPAAAGPRGHMAGQLWLLTAAALAGVTLANLSQLARGEVERIWLPFVPWLALAAPGDRRGWLVAQVGLGLVLQSSLVSPW